jgi:hypothetical protein
MRWRWYSSGTTVQGPHTAATHGASNNWKDEFLDLCADADMNEPMRAGRSRFPQRDAPQKRTPHHAGYGDGGAWSGAVGKVRANIVLHRALRI